MRDAGQRDAMVNTVCLAAAQSLLDVGFFLPFSRVRLLLRVLAMEGWNAMSLDPTVNHPLQLETKKRYGSFTAIVNVNVQYVFPPFNSIS